jgi:hypothetical protein
MADADLIRHQHDYHAFTVFVKYGTGAVLILMALLFAFVFWPVSPTP